MTTEEIVEAIRNASNGTFIGEYCSSTLMGWTNEYDELGRLVTCDPNYKDSIFTICGRDYHVTRHGWYVVIWKGKGGYCRLLNRVKPIDSILVEIDLTPDYVKKYRNKKLEELLSKCEIKYLTLDEMSEMNLYHPYRLGDIFNKNSTYKIWILTDEIENRVPKNLSRIIKYEVYK